MYEALSSKPRDSQKEKPWLESMQHPEFWHEEFSRGLAAYDDCPSALLVPGLLDFYALPYDRKESCLLGPATNT